MVVRLGVLMIEHLWGADVSALQDENLSDRATRLGRPAGYCQAASGTPLATGRRVHNAGGSLLTSRYSIPILFLAGILGSGCVTRDAPTDTDQTVSTAPSGTASTPVTPPPAAGTVTVAYTQDMAPVFAADCTRCHSGSKPDGNYSMATYEQVLKKVVAGNARSALVTSTQNRGSMYRYWSGNAAAKAELTRSWVVDNGAARTR